MVEGGGPTLLTDLSILQISNILTNERAKLLFKIKNKLSPNVVIKAYDHYQSSLKRFNTRTKTKTKGHSNKAEDEPTWTRGNTKLKWPWTPLATFSRWVVVAEVHSWQKLPAK